MRGTVSLNLTRRLELGWLLAQANTLAHDLHLPGWEQLQQRKGVVW